MKITLTMSEVRKILSDHALSEMVRGGNGTPASVRFIHRYSDGSGEDDAENITSIQRVDIEFEQADYCTRLDGHDGPCNGLPRDRCPV